MEDGEDDDCFILILILIVEIVIGITSISCTRNCENETQVLLRNYDSGYYYCSQLFEAFVDYENKVE